ncbi:hypothetical protein KFL_000120480 [Klebsormidium nitens]|uniref:Uncharacterized protein n=1 Tax=Klebsormidium nitens TaxID=105231 RepID=A0A1Y1HL78_KLENI|nr:hypothetical protein KFL_000120480 [Klebsormidium nitens]|eukprot:GAQ78402.1 hypothetical protein KFL_000120480 [Klebsormidium nitens]
MSGSVIGLSAKHGVHSQVKGLDLRPVKPWAIDKLPGVGHFPLQQFLQSSRRPPKEWAGSRPLQPRCALLTAAELPGGGGGELNLFQKLATVWKIFFPSPKKKEKVSARAMAKTRLMQTLGEEEFGLTQQQISAIGQQIGRVLEDFVELDAAPGKEAPVLESKLEGRGRLKVMFKVRRVKPAAEDGWFGDEDSQEWSPYMAGNDAFPNRSLGSDSNEAKDSFALRGKGDSFEWLDSHTLVLREHEQDSD